MPAKKKKLDDYYTQNVASPTAEEMIPGGSFIPGPTASEMTPPMDVYAQDPTARLRALEGTEGIKDATIPLAANTMMLASPAGAPVSNYLNTIKALLSAHSALAQGKMDLSKAGSTATSLASPFASTIIGALRSRFNIPEMTLPRGFGSK